MIGSSKSIWGFDPRSVPGCSLWLDAADASQVTFSSSTNVNTWIDKSGFNNNCSNQSLGSTITYPGTKVNGLNTVNFTAGCIRGAFNSSSVINTTDVTIFIVTVETAPNNNLRMFSLTTAANYQDDTANTMLVYCAPGNYQLTFYRAGAMPTPYTVTQNVPFIYSLTQTSGTGSMWLNGGSNTTASITTSAFAVTNYNIGTQYLANQNYTGLMCEILVYKSLLTTSQRQQVEGYLAWKWGLTTYLPAISPLSIPGCQLWLDGADSSTLVLSGSNVTQWNDKSGNGFNGTAVNASVGSPIAPSYVTNSINGLSAITMSGTSYFTGSTNVNSTTLTCFFIGNCVFGTGGSSQQRIIGLSVTGLDDYSSTLRPIPLAVISGGTQLLSYRNANMASATVVSGTNFIGCCLFDGTSNYMYKDGTLGTQVASSGTFTTSIYGVGSDAGTQFMGFTSSLGTNCLVGKIGEILVYNTALTTTQRQSIEGYLARKWGFTSMYSALPSIHPFSSIRPHLRTFQPTDIPGCQLWLDGADQSSMTFSGSSITQWNDKSGNEKNATIASGRIGATYSSGLKCVYFQSASVGYQTSYLANPTNETMFVVANIDSPSTQTNNTLICGQQGARSLGVGWNNSGDATLCAYLNSHVAWQTSTPSGSYTAGTTGLITGQVSGGSTLSIAMNGATFTTGSGGGFYANTTTYLGVDTTTTAYYYKGFVMEILFYNSVLNPSQRQQVEGYLAHKWGLTTPIPSTHPFKSFPSATVPLKPLAIETVSLTSLTTSNGVINWTTTNATGYIWYVGTGSGSGQVATGTITNSSTLTATVTYAFVIGTTYYAWVIPYNLDGLGPTTISAAVTFSAVFSPTDITGLQLWLDGNDPAGTGTQPANGATVSTWVDKSGNGYNATAAPSRVVGTYSTSFRAVNFATSSTGYITSYSAAPTNETMFVVFNNPSPSSANNIIIGGIQGARSLGAGHSSAGTGTVGNLNTQVAWLATLGTYTGGTTVLTTSQFTTSTNTISLNGGAAASGGAPGFTAGRVTYLGVDASNGSYYYVGYGMEILFYNSVLSTNDRQKIEGYLAWKWGIQSSLPAGHPYKSAAP